MEWNPLTPRGEYANSTVGRERVLEFFSARDGIPLTLLRLCYAVELRYGVLLDIAQKVHGGRPIDLSNGYFNCIWQGDASDTPDSAFTRRGQLPAHNLESVPRKSSRCARSQRSLANCSGIAPRFNGNENPDALLCNSRPLCDKFGEPSTPLLPIVRWIADWVRREQLSPGANPLALKCAMGRY